MGSRGLVLDIGRGDVFSRLWKTPALCCQVSHTGGMLVNITVRHIPPEIRDELARRAARRGQSSQEFLAALLTEAAQRPDRLDVVASIERLRQTVPPFDGRELFVRGDDGRY